MKRVMYFSANGYLGGAEKFLLTACLGHLRSGKIIPVIVYFNDGEAVQQARAAGIKVVILKK